MVGYSQLYFVKNRKSRLSPVQEFSVILKLAWKSSCSSTWSFTCYLYYFCLLWPWNLWCICFNVAFRFKKWVLRQWTSEDLIKIHSRAHSSARTSLGFAYLNVWFPGSLCKLSRGVGLYPWASSPMLMVGDISEKMGEVERNWYVEITVNFCCENRSKTKTMMSFLVFWKEFPTGKHESALLCCSRWHKYCGFCAKAWKQNVKWPLFLDTRSANRHWVQLNCIFNISFASLWFINGQPCRTHKVIH